jgi:peptidoglycan/xylan/chitin deacetylase (PgdA/CDA1 family)
MTRKIISLLLIPVLVASTVVAALPSIADAESTNLIQNSGFETSTVTDQTTPDFWSPDAWGANTPSQTYVSAAHTGTKAVQTTITNWQSGDAKWVQAPVSVSAGEAYHYSDWYKASVQTNVWAQFLTTSNTYQYQLVKVVNASTAQWSSTAVDITVPTGIQKVSIFHVLASNGQLTVDDVSLTHNVSCPANNTGSISNGGFENVCASDPTTSALGWQQVQYGTTTAIFNGQSSDAHSGSKAATVTNNTEGAEAGYQAVIQSPLSNQHYNLKFWQKGDTYIYAYAAFVLQNGTTEYQSLMSAPATLGEWSQYSDSFISPANTTSMILTLATSGDGTVAFDDVAINKLTNQTPSTFSAGMVSMTFDDGSSSSYTNGFSVLKQNGYKGTFYLNAGDIDTPTFMNSAQVKALAANGQEIGSHMYHHSDMVQLDTPTLQNELTGNKTSLQGIVGASNTIASFASPYGSFTSSRVDTIMQYATSHRDTDGKLNTKANLDVRQIHGRLVTASTTAATVQSWITEAKTTHSWLVLVYHNIASSTANQDSDVAGYNVKPADFSKHVAAIKSSGLAVKTVASAIAALSAE